MTAALLVALLGSAGAVSRFLVDGWTRSWLPDDLPWPTLIINVSGSALLGVIAGLAAHGLPDTLRVAVGAGFCGGYTTFSAASFETVRLLERGQFRSTLVYSAASLGLCAVAAAVGLALAGG